MINKESAQIVSNKKIAKDIYLTDLHAPKIAEQAYPGQFVELAPLAPNSILNRPMAIYDADPDSGTIKICFHVIGSNTREYAKLSPNDTLGVIGPLGRRFNFSLSHNQYILVAGGIGITSLHLIGKYLASHGKKIITLIGARSKEYIACQEDFIKFGEAYIATDNGSEGHKGYVHELLGQTVRANGRSPVQIIYCGPRPMMKAVTDVCKELNIPHLAIMEEMMACGFGICAACVCQTTEGQKKICTDGPVFDGGKVIWEKE